MTIAKTGNRSQYAGDGSTVAFVFPFRFFAAGDLGVYVLAAGVETKQTLTTNYTVSNTDTEDGGTVTFLVAPANGTVVTIIGETPLTQVADYTANDAFPALTHETALDRTVRLVQQQEEKLGRALVAPISDTASLELPFDRANSFLAFDASKNPIAAVGITDVPVSPYMEGVLSSSDAASFIASVGLDQGITFSPRTGVSYAEGLLYYDDDRKALTFFNDENDVAMNIGQEEWIYARNTTGSTITNGSAVYVSGASGNRPLISLADADADATSKLIGIVTHDIENNSNGFVCVSGEVRNVNTAAFTAGNTLYVSSTAGALTATSPGDGKFNYIVGTVLNAHATQGIILVSPVPVPNTQSTAVWLAGASTVESTITPAKLQAKIDANPNPIKAWVNFNGVQATGTYSRTGTLVTVTLTGHGMTTGMRANLDFTTGTATDGTYTVTVVDANTFTVVDAASGATSGNVTRNLFIRASLNVTSITDNGVGDYTINFTTALADANYAVSGFANFSGSAAPAGLLSYGNTYAPTTTTLRLSSADAAIGSAADASHINVTVIR